MTLCAVRLFPIVSRILFSRPAFAFYFIRSLNRQPQVSALAFTDPTSLGPTLKRCHSGEKTSSPEPYSLPARLREELIHPVNSASLDNGLYKLARLLLPYSAS